MAGHLAGKIAIVTGGSGTIGKAIARVLLTEGASVVISGRNEDRLLKAQNSLKEMVPDSLVSILACDVTKEGSVESFFQTIDEKHGGCDLLVNNAGTMAPGATVDLSAQQFERVLKANVLGPFLCSREAMKRMKNRGGGRIINVGSISAMSPRPDSAPYTTTKFALLGLTQSLALDCRPFGIGVGIIHPGNVMSNLLTPEEIARREETEGFIDPEDVASCVLAMADMPVHANVLELTVIPTKQPLVGRG